MSHSKISLKEAAEYLHIPVTDLQYLVDKGKIPARKERGHVWILKSDLQDWANQFILQPGDQRLGRSHYSATHIWSGLGNVSRSLSDFLFPAAMEPGLRARTKPSVLRELTRVALRTNLVCDSDKLLRYVQDREALHPTGLKEGVAIPHPRFHTPDLFFESFLVIARIPGGVPFGAMDGEESDLFFMPCTTSEHDHTFCLSRLTTLLKKTPLAAELRRAESAQEMMEAVKSLEEQILGTFAKK